MRWQLPQWNALEIKPFGTVIAIKGVALKDICKDEEGEQVITCSAFEDTIVEVLYNGCTEPQLKIG